MSEKYKETWIRLETAAQGSDQRKNRPIKK